MSAAVGSPRSGRNEVAPGASPGNPSDKGTSPRSGRHETEGITVAVRAMPPRRGSLSAMTCFPSAGALGYSMAPASRALAATDRRSEKRWGGQRAAGALGYCACAQLFIIMEWASFRGAQQRAAVAQLVEQRFRKPRVGGSSPLGGSIFFNDLRASALSLTGQTVTNCHKTAAVLEKPLQVQPSARHARSPGWKGQSGPQAPHDDFSVSGASSASILSRSAGLPAAKLAGRAALP